MLDWTELYVRIWCGPLGGMVDTADLKSASDSCAGSSPAAGNLCARSLTDRALDYGSRG